MNRPPFLVIDLDGTLVDSRLRLFTLFTRLVPQASISFEKYWKLKRQGLGNLMILEEDYQFSSNALKEFNASWHSQIESGNLLQLDTLIPGVDSALSRLSRDYKLLLATNRQLEHGVHSQLEEFGIGRHFEYVGITQQRQTKFEMLRGQFRFDSNDWMISDAGSDALYAKELGMKSCAVLSGFLDENTLRKYSPDRVENSISEFASKIAN